MFRCFRNLRGSKRVLVFVFVASVIWLIVDIAVLRVSIGDVNNRLAKERAFRDLRRAIEKGINMNKGKDMKNGTQKNTAKHSEEDEDYEEDEDSEEDTDGLIDKPVRRFRVHTKKEHVIEKNNIQGDKIDIKLPAVAGKVPVDLLDSDASLLKNNTIKKDSIALIKPVKTPNSSIKGFNKPQPAKEELSMKEEKQIEKLLIQEKNKKSLEKEQKETEKLLIQETNKKSLLKEEKQTEKLLIQETNKKSLEKEEKQIEKLLIQETNKKFLVKEEKPIGEKLKQSETVHVNKAGVHQVLSLDVTAAPRDPGAVGQFGQAAIVSTEEEAQVKLRWDEGHFNVYLSEKIPVDRAIPDTRPQTCTRDMVHDDLPSTSVIFCFVDEVWSTLLRSVHSVLNRSPPHLLKEIILVDDFSQKDYLKDDLDKYMANFPKVRILRLKERQGLIRARMVGAAAAKGEVLTFLDSHVECNVGWLEPLLERIYLNRKMVPCPVIEVISDQDMSYKLVDNFQRGVFNWPLVFAWNALSDDYVKKNNMTVADPIRCPVMAGGLFSIDKKYFYELGAYDPGLEVWGGENMEISFKIWMCGGEIEIIPCSRVGHIFRGQNPYDFPNDRHKTVERNLARVAEVWLDEYKDLFYGHGYNHLLNQNTNLGDLTEQIKLRNKLKCKSFKWYLDNVYPELEAPLVKAEGLVLNRGLRKCLSVLNESLVFELCDLTKQNQHFNYTWLLHIRQQDMCVEYNIATNTIHLQPCDRSLVTLHWLHKSSELKQPDLLTVEHTSKLVCLEVHQKTKRLHLAACTKGNLFQQWEFTNYYTK
ncbi:polypeptide N-acetylgalactosaminyltransferase 5 [Corythoichthys intestinalis]|uniref:polypeptide N-acetylgalactosaminyltransferase 5 n=1 Tax=Corythoichthys intestinalis TaxID=161448 RepID=UPI0025A4E03B|nr:polypeptide N-acetylgalactosaminyltransferase 5 [Corythoichthys intestinalis]